MGEYCDPGPFHSLQSCRKNRSGLRRLPGSPLSSDARGSHIARRHQNEDEEA